MAERLAPLCPNVPAGELAELTARLATSELMRAGAGSVAAEEPMSVSGNQVVWLPGPSGAAIVLPAGEDEPRRIPSLAELRALAVQHAETARTFGTRGAIALRQVRSVLLDAYHAHLGVRLSDR